MKKCSCCKNLRDNQDYINKFGKETKTCLKCRERNTERNLNIRKVVEPIIEPVEPITETKVETEPNMNYYLLLHNRKWRKFNREFEERASFPRHKYEMRHVFVDIRDCLTYNY